MEGLDTAVCLMNYRRDGTPFYNRVFVAPLRGVDGRVVNFVGVQCEVTESVAKLLMQEQRSLYVGGGGGGGAAAAPAAAGGAPAAAAAAAPVAPPAARAKRARH